VNHSGKTTRDDPGLQASLVKWQRAGVGVFILLLVAFPLYRVMEAVRRDQALANRESALVANGRQLYALNCASCHGISGEGVDAPALNSKEFLQNVSDEQIYRITSVGIPGSEMPAWWNEVGGPLTADQIKAITAYVRSWEKTAPSRPDWRNPTGASPSPEGG